MEIAGESDGLHRGIEERSERMSCCWALNYFGDRSDGQRQATPFLSEFESLQSFDSMDRDKFELAMIFDMLCPIHL